MQGCLQDQGVQGPRTPSEPGPEAPRLLSADSDSGALAAAVVAAAHAAAGEPLARRSPSGSASPKPLEDCAAEELGIAAPVQVSTQNTTFACTASRSRSGAMVAAVAAAAHAAAGESLTHCSPSGSASPKPAEDSPAEQPGTAASMQVFAHLCMHCTAEPQQHAGCGCCCSHCC